MVRVLRLLLLFNGCGGGGLDWPTVRRARSTSVRPGFFFQFTENPTSRFGRKPPVGRCLVFHQSHGLIFNSLDFNFSHQVLLLSEGGAYATRCTTCFRTALGETLPMPTCFRGCCTADRALKKAPGCFVLNYSRRIKTINGAIYRTT